MNQVIQKFIRLESLPGMLLILATFLALFVANSPFAAVYESAKNTPFFIGAGSFEIHKPMILWINDGLMAVFFFLVGLELKREWIAGHLKDTKSRILPLAGAVGGFLLPALIYFGLNFNNPNALSGWAIPAATDIAFALGVLVLLGSRAPLSLKVFLTSLAIFDDIAAVLVIAFFFTKELSFVALLTALFATLGLFLLNYFGINKKRFFVLAGLIIWVAVLKSGVHATLAGIVTGLFIPIEKHDDGPSLLEEFEHALHSLVVYFVLPVFAFFNAGLSFEGFSLEQLLHPVSFGIFLGLFVGKQLGVFGFCWLAIKSGAAKLPQGTSYKQLYGVSILTGIGFTMSLFIESLAFPGANTLGVDPRLGILLGSFICAVQGYLWLRFSKND